jgi:hypothetical protein
MGGVKDLYVSPAFTCTPVFMDVKTKTDYTTRIITQKNKPGSNFL